VDAKRAEALILSGLEMSATLQTVVAQSMRAEIPLDVFLEMATSAWSVISKLRDEALAELRPAGGK
jgi:hypothetical protein